MTESTPIPIAGLAHVGIRAHDLARSLRFYELLGFTLTAGITHVSLLCPDIQAARARLEAAGFPLSGGPVRFSPTAQAIFVRDPDGTVIELHQRG